MPGNCSYQARHPKRINVEYLLNLLVAGSFQRSEQHIASVINQDINSSKLLERTGDRVVMGDIQRQFRGCWKTVQTFHGSGGCRDDIASLS
jgi:hypothetical protein